MKFRRMSRLLILLGLMLGLDAVAQAGAIPASQTIAGLGTISFPTSTKSSEARTAFARGMLLLHLFEYEDAAKAFRQAQKIDPGFAMAYWGEAMTHNHGIWNQLNVKAGRAALAGLAPTPAARAAAAPTAREKGYLAAVEILYAPGGTKAQRDARYCDAMQRLAKEFPVDNNAQLFYALALLGRSEGVRDIPVYLRAGAIAERSFRVNPRNPGAAHYWIHSMDDPQHAAGALEAARALSKIAPDAGHAQHMTSHIFMALGMWDDVVEANENAMRVVNAHAKAKGQPQIECGHYPFWLEYGYFQQGRYNAGEKELQACTTSAPQALAWSDAHPSATGAYTIHGERMTRARFAEELQDALIDMRPTAVIESGDWNGAALKVHVDTSAIGAHRAWNEFTDGYAAAMRNDVAAAHAQLAALKATRKSGKIDPGFPQQAQYMEVLESELQGLIDVRRGDTAAGMTALRKAAERYDTLSFDFGPPVPIKPPHELLGEQLLAQGKAAEASAEFAAVLKTAPNHSLSVLGSGARTVRGRRQKDRDGNLSSPARYLACSRRRASGARRSTQVRGHEPVREFLQRLRERKLAQWALAYAAGAWVMLQVLSLFAGAYHWPDAVLRIAIDVAVAGFLVALTLAWFHGERGAQRVSRGELALLFALALCGTAFVWRSEHGARDASAPSLASNGK